MGLQKDNYFGPQPDYGFDTDGEAVTPEEGYALVPKGEVILAGDKPFDIYAGWIVPDGYQARWGHHARSRGRWTAWERKVAATQTAEGK